MIPVTKAIGGTQQYLDHRLRKSSESTRAVASEVKTGNNQTRSFFPDESVFQQYQVVEIGLLGGVGCWCLAQLWGRGSGSRALGYSYKGAKYYCLHLVHLLVHSHRVDDVNTLQRASPSLFISDDCSESYVNDILGSEYNRHGRYRKIDQIFNALMKDPQGGLTNHEISMELGIPSATTHRILQQLSKYDLVYKRPNDARYFFGSALLRYAQCLLATSDEISISRPYLDKMYRLINHTVFYSKFNGNYCVVMDVRGPANQRIAVALGELMPLYCSAAGKVVLAFLHKQQRQELYKKSNSNGLPKTPSSIELIEEQLTQFVIHESRTTTVSFMKVSCLFRSCVQPNGTIAGSITVEVLQLACQMNSCTTTLQIWWL